MNVVITQPMLFPWVGLIEQVRLSNIFVFYDDVQFSKGSFTNRVQIKTSQGMCWMTVPIEKTSSAMPIKDVKICYKQNWQSKHFKLLQQSLAGAIYLKEALDLVDSVYAKNHKYIGQLAKDSMMSLIKYFELLGGRKFLDINELEVPGSGSGRVLEIVKKVGGNVYISGNGGKNYLNHAEFERFGVNVRYVNYEMQQYLQQHGQFTPFVTGLDLVANCGKSGAIAIKSTATDWRTNTSQN